MCTVPVLMIAVVLCGLCCAHAGTVHIDPQARPAGPNGLRARALSPTTVELRWQGTADNPDDPSRFGTMILLP